jgi:hypothetical protein
MHLPPTGTLALQITGDINETEQLSLSFSEIRVRSSNENLVWIKINSTDHAVALLANENTDIPAGPTALPAGGYTQISLKVEGATAVIMGKNVMREIPEGRGQYIMITDPFIIKKGRTTTVVINFDEDKSVTET